MKIDFHCHLFYERLNTVESLLRAFNVFEGYGFYDRMFQSLDGIESFQADDIISKTSLHAKRAGLDRVVLLSASAKENSRIKEWVAAYPKLFIPFFNPPEKSDNPTEISQLVEVALTEDGFKGLKILLPFRKKLLSDKNLYPAYEMATKNDVPVLFHTGYPPPGTPGTKMGLSKANPAILDETIASFPNLKIILAHCGYPWTDVGIALACQFPNVYLDISNMTYMMPNKLREVLLHAKEVIGLNKILYGSDGFCPEMIEVCVSLFEKVDYLSPTEIKKIMGLNAQKLLKIQ